MPDGDGRRGRRGFRFTGRKTFCSQAPVATVISTSAVLGEPGPGAEVLHAGVPLSSPGVSLVETWDTLGMRGTASHDLVFEDVFVPADKILGRRPYGRLAGPLLVAAIHFAPVAGAVYLGIAQGAYDEALRVLAARAGDPAPAVVRLLGEMAARLRVARWALLAAVEEVGDDPPADEPTLVTLMTAKRHAVCEAKAVVDLALDAVGGAAFFRTSPLERAFRDVRGGPFHPSPPRRLWRWPAPPRWPRRDACRDHVTSSRAASFEFTSIRVEDEAVEVMDRVLRQPGPAGVVDDLPLGEGGGAHPALDALHQGDVLHLENLVDVPDAVDLGLVRLRGLQVEVPDLARAFRAVGDDLQDHEVSAAGVAQQAGVGPGSRLT